MPKAKLRLFLPDLFWKGLEVLFQIRMHQGTRQHMQDLASCNIQSGHQLDATSVWGGEGGIMNGSFSVKLSARPEKSKLQSNLECGQRPSSSLAFQSLLTPMCWTLSGCIKIHHTSFPLPWLLGNLLHALFSLPPSPLVVHKLTIAFHALFSLQSKAEAAACAPCNQTFNSSAWLPPMGEIDTGVSTTCVQKVIVSASPEEMYPEQLFFCSSSMPSIWALGGEVNEQICWNITLECNEASTLKLDPICQVSYFHSGALFKWFVHCLSPPACKDRENWG